MEDREAVEKQAEHLVRIVEITGLEEDLEEHFRQEEGLENVTIEILNKEFEHSNTMTSEQLKKVVNLALTRLNLRVFYSEVM